MLSAPGAYGDAAGEKIQGTLGKVGGPVVCTFLSLLSLPLSHLCLLYCTLHLPRAYTRDKRLQTDAGIRQGKGLSTIASPVGGLVEPLVGGLFKAPENFAHATDAIDDVDRHNEEMERPIAGEEQTGANPLGLHQGGKGEGA